MKYEWIYDYVKSLKGAQVEFKKEWEVNRFMIRDKMFGMVGGDNEGNPIITLKLKPENGQLLRDAYNDIKPGYYMNKEHWNSVYMEGIVPDEVVKDMVNESYSLIFGAFSKKVQKEISE